MTQVVRPRVSPINISSLVKQGPGRSSSGKKVWSIDVETVWVPFLTATNLLGDTNIAPDVLGAPILYAKDETGKVKFGRNGLPREVVQKDITREVRGIQGEFVAQISNYAGAVAKANPEAYAEYVKAIQEAAVPILEANDVALEEGLERQRLEREEALAKAKAAEEKLRASMVETATPEVATEELVLVSAD